MELREFVEMRLNPDRHDEIMRKYHFCNIRRADDTTSVHIKRIVRQSENPEWCAIMCRMVNRWDSLEKLAPALVSPETWEALAPDIMPDVKINTRAYKVNTPLGLNKPEYVLGSSGRVLSSLRQWDQTRNHQSPKLKQFVLLNKIVALHQSCDWFPSHLSDFEHTLCEYEKYHRAVYVVVHDLEGVRRRTSSEDDGCLYTLVELSRHNVLTPVKRSAGRVSCKVICGGTCCVRLYDHISHFSSPCYC